MLKFCRCGSTILSGSGSRSGEEGPQSWDRVGIFSGIGRSDDVSSESSRRPVERGGVRVPLLGLCLPSSGHGNRLWWTQVESMFDTGEPGEE